MANQTHSFCNWWCFVNVWQWIERVQSGIFNIQIYSNVHTCIWMQLETLKLNCLILYLSCCTIESFILLLNLQLAISLIRYMAVRRSNMTRMCVWVFPAWLVPSLPKILQWLLGNVTGCDVTEARFIQYTSVLFVCMPFCIAHFFSMTIKGC